MAARAHDHIEGFTTNTAQVSAMVSAIERATAALESAPLSDMKPGVAEGSPALLDYQAGLVRQAKADLAARLRGALDRFEKVAARKLAALGVK